MNLNFTKEQSLEKLKEELIEIEGLPPINVIIDELKDKSYHIVYAEENGKIIGGYLWYKKADKAHIYLLFIKKQYRGRGYSNEIIRYAIDQINKEGFSKISTCTNQNNQKSLCAFLKNNFKIVSFILEKNMFMLARELDQGDSTNLIYDLLFEEDIDRKKEILEEVLRNPSSSLESLRKINLNGINYNEMSPLSKFMCLKYMADSNNPEGVNALKELGKKLEEVSCVEPEITRFKLLKYIAIHSEKEISQKAILELYNNLNKILKIKNQELQASLLRYLAVHTNGKIQEEVVKFIKQIKSPEIKATSLDYFNSYLENGRR